MEGAGQYPTSVGEEIPLGLVADFAGAVHATAVVNFFTKDDGDHCRRDFQPRLFLCLHVSPSARRQGTTRASRRVSSNSGSAAMQELSAEAMEVRPGNILVAVRDPRNLLICARCFASGHDEAGRGRNDRAYLPPRTLL